MLPLKVTVASSLLQQAEQARLEARRYLEKRAEIPSINVKQVLIPASDPRCTIRFKTSLIENLQNSERNYRSDRHENNEREKSSTVRPVTVVNSTPFKDPFQAL